MTFIAMLIYLEFSILTCVPGLPFSSRLFFSFGYIKFNFKMNNNLAICILQFITVHSKSQTLFFHVCFSCNYFFRNH